MVRYISSANGHPAAINGVELGAVFRFRDFNFKPEPDVATNKSSVGQVIALNFTEIYLPDYRFDMLSSNHSQAEIQARFLSLPQMDPYTRLPRVNNPRSCQYGSPYGLRIDTV